MEDQSTLNGLQQLRDRSILTVHRHPKATEAAYAYRCNWQMTKKAGEAVVIRGCRLRRLNGPQIGVLD
jgi:hypothetical protein